MRIRVAVPEKHVQPAVINAALEAVTRLDQSMIETGDVPPFDPDNPGVRWRPENMGDEHFDHAGTVLQRGWGDCDDLAPWRAASLRQSGEDPGATAIVVKSGPEMYHALVRRSDGSNDDPSVAAGMRPSSVVGDGSQFISVWACDPHDGRLYQGQLAPTVGPLGPHCGPQFAVRPLVPPDDPSVVGSGHRHHRPHVVGYQARVDLPVCGSKLVHVRAYKRHHPRHTSGMVPYSLSVTSGDAGWNAAQALSVACAGALQAGRVAGTAGAEDSYKLFALHRLLAGHHPSDVTVELSRMMAEDAAQSAAAAHAVHGRHGYAVVGSFGSFLSSALGIVQQVAPVLSSIPGIGTALSAAMPYVSLLSPHATAPPSGAPAPGLSPQPAALAAAHPVPGPVLAPPPPVSWPGGRPPPPTGRTPGAPTYAQRPAPPPPTAPAAPAAPPQGGGGGGGFNFGNILKDVETVAPMALPLLAAVLGNGGDDVEIHPDTGEVIHNANDDTPVETHPDTGEPIHDADAPDFDAAALDFAQASAAFDALGVADFHPDTGEPIHDVDDDEVTELHDAPDDEPSFEADMATFEQASLEADFASAAADFASAQHDYENVQDVPEPDAGDEPATYADDALPDTPLPPEANDFAALAAMHDADVNGTSVVGRRVYF